MNVSGHCMSASIHFPLHCCSGCNYTLYSMDYSGTTAPIIVGVLALGNKVTVLAERLNLSNMLQGYCICPCLIISL